MGVHSCVAVAIHGPEDKLDFLCRMAPLFFDMNEIDECVNIASEEPGVLRWENHFVKWYYDQCTPTYYADLYQFKLIWKLAEKWELVGKLVEYCHDYPDHENCITTINGGGRLEHPQLNVSVSIDW